ncbi:hypothetical protein G210_2474 [Candida maltosa Xu316]|uniref:FMR1-interacting protein 1 conserved domain-containing protein n=1 Tax=Candida maltosa (strain Xu316) TaxID=1245528 RepID=M3ILH4_CANMX|nr:hypothetical protein G210_2474 [Candida maltosa Xu316]
MIKEPYYSSELTSIKSTNDKNFSLVSLDLPSVSTNQNLKHAPPLDYSSVKQRRDSIEPYYTKPIKIGVLPPAILNQFTYYFNDESAIIDDDDDDFEGDMVYSNGVVAPQNVLNRVSDNYEEQDTEDKFDFKFMENVTVPSVTSDERIHIFAVDKDELLNKSNNPNILTNQRSRKLSDKLSAPDLPSLQFASDFFDIFFFSIISFLHRRLQHLTMTDNSFIFDLPTHLPNESPSIPPPKPSTDSVVEETIEDDDEEQRAKTSGPVVIQGTNITLQTEEDIAKWIEERKKNWPSKTNVDRKKRAIEEKEEENKSTEQQQPSKKRKINNNGKHTG